MLKISTSSKEKKLEILSFYNNIQVLDGLDLPEVESDDWLEVIKFKALDMHNALNQDCIVVEDTVLEINGKPVNDIKFRLNEIENNIESYIGKTVSMRVSLGTVINGVLFVFTELLDGVIINKSLDGFGFDPYFGIKYNDNLVSLAELKSNGLKNKFSPRISVVGKMLKWYKDRNVRPDHIFKLSDIRPWNGEYQE